MSTCLGSRDKGEGRCESRCGNAAVTVLIVGCVHEHVGKRPACEEHRRKSLSGKMICRECRLVDGHRCLLHVAERTPDAPGGAGEAQGG